MIIASNLGFPRLGSGRELKQAIEQYWAGEIAQDELTAVGRAVRQERWRLQAAAGLDHVPSNDFSFYDHVLDMACVVGAVPERYRALGGSPIDAYFAMARGAQSARRDSTQMTDDVPALQMTKWFDTNYHYIVPEFDHNHEFELEATKPVDEFAEAMAFGSETRPVLIGPVSLLLLGQMSDRRGDPIDLMDRLVPVYEELLRRLARAGAHWVQLDEPGLVLDLSPAALRAFDTAYGRLGKAAPGLRILLATYFGGLHTNLPPALRLPVAGLHLDLVRGPEQLELALASAPQTLALSLGVEGCGTRRLRHSFAAGAEPGGDRGAFAPGGGGAAAGAALGES